MDILRLAYPDAALHEASAAAVARVLEAHDLEVEHVPLAPGVRPDESIDLFASAWLPRTDAPLIASGQMQPLGLLYRPAFIWCAALDGVASLHDLAAAAALDRRILAAPPFAALADQVLAAYGLDRAGYVIERVSESEAAAWADCAGPARIIPLCRPHDRLHAPGLRTLEDPLGVLGADQEARLLIRHDLHGQVDSDLIDELEALTLGNKVVSAMAHAMRIQGMSAEAAADAWQRGKLTPRA